MLVLLPPSESKTAPTAGAPVDLDALAHPQLTPARVQVLDAVAEAVRSAAVVESWGLPAAAAAEVVKAGMLRDAPAAPAARVYSGVLYDAAKTSTWDGATLARAAERVRIFSGL